LEHEVQDVLAEAIQSYEKKLTTHGFFPDHMEEMTWEKAVWLGGCREYNVKIHHNTELIKIVWFRFLTLFGANYLSSNSSGRETHLRGVINTKDQALVETTYGFEIAGDGAVEENRKKVEKLKKGSHFVYHVRSL
jgi:hypothetical protein